MQYFFKLVVGEREICEFGDRFSNFRRRLSPLLGNFPSAHVFQNYTTNSINVASRGEELRLFLEESLNVADEGGLVGSPELHSALGVTSHDALQALLSVAAARKQTALIIRRMRLANFEVFSRAVASAHSA